MSSLFIRILGMTLTGSVVIAVVLLVRLLLKRMPKIYAYALWGAVLFRLLCPLSFSSDFSVLKPIPVDTTPGISSVSYQPVREIIQASNQYVQVQQEMLSTAAPVKAIPSPMQLAAGVWLLGAVCMALYSLAQYAMLRRRLTNAVVLHKNIYLCDAIPTAFVLGVTHPRIYLPAATPRDERKYIIAHERQHVRRGDPLWKLLGYAALCLHWFNPLVWLAFRLSGKDMEMSCDEAVIQRLGPEIRADYSHALLQLATRRPILSGMPLAFGEGDTRSRVMNMARWKQPKVWVSVLCAVACIITLVACALNPSSAEQPIEELTRISGPADIGAWELYFTLPEGCTSEMRSKDSSRSDTREAYELVFTDGVHTIGGVMAFPIPENVTPDNWDWFQALPFPEWKDETVGYSAGGSMESVINVEFFSDVPPGQERTILNDHNLYFINGWIYDLWFNKLTVKPEIMYAILDSLSTGSAAQLPVSCQAENLPDGISIHHTPEGSVQLLLAEKTIGAIAAYVLPANIYDLEDKHYTWLEKVGIPDLSDPRLQIDGMFAWDGGNGCRMTVTDDFQSPAIRRTHTFTIDGNVLYDFWLDELLVDTDTQFAIGDTIRYSAASQPTKTTLRFTIEGIEETAEATLFSGPGYSLYIPDREWIYLTDNGQSMWESQYNPDVRFGVMHLENMSLPAAQQWIRQKCANFQLVADKQGGLGGTDEQGNLFDVRFVPAGQNIYAICCTYPMEAAEGFGARINVITDTFALKN